VRVGWRTLQVDRTAWALRLGMSEERKKFAYFYPILFKERYM